MEWDFSSDSDIAGDMERPKRRSKALSRNNSITFAERDQVRNTYDMKHKILTQFTIQLGKKCIYWLM